MHLNYCERLLSQSILVHLNQFFAVLAMWLFLAGVSTAAESVTKIVIAYEDKTQFPYYLGDTSSVLPAPGAAVELVLMLEKSIPGIEIELQRYPWARCVALLQAGKVDAIFNASYNDTRAEYGAYPRSPEGVLDESRRLTTISYSWYALSKHKRDTSKSVAAPLGYSIVDSLRKQGYTVHEAPKSIFALRMILAGHVNRVALQTVTGDHLISSDRAFRKIERILPPIVVKPYFLLFSKSFYQQHTQLTETLWTELTQLREQELDGLIQKYMDDPGRQD